MVLFESLGKVFYSPSIVTMALSCTISEMKRYAISRKSRFFHTPFAFDGPVRGPRLNIATLFGVRKLEWCGYPTV